jgi:hypothetical protein
MFEQSTEKFSVELIDNIFHITLKKNAEYNLEDAILTNEIIGLLKKSNGRVSALIDVRLIKSISTEARIFISDESTNEHLNKIAVIVGSPLSLFITNFVFRLSKNTIKKKMFSDKEEAFLWLTN